MLPPCECGGLPNTPPIYLRQMHAEDTVELRKTLARALTDLRSSVVPKPHTPTPNPYEALGQLGQEEPASG